ncbi:putative glucose-6-phosphate 1-epimerase [Capsicum chacoense]
MGQYAPVWDHKAAVELTKKLSGINQVTLRNPKGASVRVSLLGGQVTSWRNDRGEELLFSSSKAIPKSSKAARGGISVSFPQYGNSGSVEQHGFARNIIWTIEDDPPSLKSFDTQGQSFIDLLLKLSEDELKFSPHVFEFRLRVALASDGSLSLISRIRNINSKPFKFAFAYQTYFSVSNISEVRLEGLETLDYRDNLCPKELFTEQGDAITFETEVDRIYHRSPDCIAVLDHERKRTYLIKKEGLPDTVVWNPWQKKSKAMGDLGNEEYKHMLCVDGAAIEKPIILKPGKEWAGRVELVVVPSTLYSDDF